MLDALNIHRPVTLVGSAIGGAIALDFAAFHGDRVAAVMAIGPAAYLDPRPNVIASADRIATMPMAHNIQSAMEVIYPKVLRNKPARMARFMGIQMATDPTSLAITSKMVGGTGFRDILPKVQVRTWIVATTLFAGRPAS